MSVSHNIMEGCTHGIGLRRVVSDHVSGNTIRACTGVASILIKALEISLKTTSGKAPGTYFLSYTVGGNEPTGSVFRNNLCAGASNIAIRNHGFNAANIWAEGNQWTNKPLIGAATLTSGASSATIAHGGIAPHATILLTNMTQTAASRQAVSGYYTGVATNDFAVATGDGNNFGDSVGIRYQIL